MPRLMDAVYFLFVVLTVRLWTIAVPMTKLGFNVGFKAPCRVSTSDRVYAT